MADALDVSGDYLIEGTTTDTAKAKFEDRKLLLQFQEVEKLQEEDKQVVKKLIDAFLTKNTFRNWHHGRRLRRTLMERFINIHVEKLPEGVYLATSDDVPGLVAQGRTVTETMEIARDVARKLLESQAERRNSPTLKVIGDSFDCALVVGV
jgi:predicted RNase H-like HicB family nuclease